MRHVAPLLAALAALLGLPTLAAGPERVVLVACAPGFPGTSAEAQPFMDALATVLAGGAKSRPGAVGAVYLPGEAEGVARLRERDAGLALVTLPFLLQHGTELGLTARLQVEVAGSGLLERWSLVARKGRVVRPADLAGLTILSTAGYAPAFVRGALRDWGRIPDGVTVTPTAQILSALRKASTGADVAVLLDGAQAAALPTLPFASELEVVARSDALPTALVATVGTHLPTARWGPLEKALLALASDPAGAAALAGIRMVRFAPLDAAALASARARTSGGAR
jgi:hypothetical protein